MQVAQGRTGVDAELLRQAPPERLVVSECLRLPAGAEQHGHELCGEPLVPRVFGGRAPHLLGETGRPARGETVVDTVQQRGQPFLLQACAYGLGPVAGDAGERVAVPQAERLVQNALRLRVAVGVAGLCGQAPEAVQVDVGGGGREQVAAGPALYRHRAVALRGQGAPQTCQVALERAPRGGGRGVAPHAPDQPIGGERDPRGQEERGEDASLLR